MHTYAGTRARQAICLLIVNDRVMRSNAFMRLQAYVYMYVYVHMGAGTYVCMYDKIFQSHFYFHNYFIYLAFSLYQRARFSFSFSFFPAK